MLKEAHNFKQVDRARIATRAEHTHQAFRRNVCSLRETGEANSCVDLIAQNCLRNGHLAGEHGFEAFAQKFLAKLGIPLGAVTNGFLKVASQWHEVYYLLRL